MDNNKIGDFIKIQRNKSGLTQIELSDKSGAGLRFIRELESGKKTVRLDKVLQVLNFLGYELSPSKIKDNLS